MRLLQLSFPRLKTILQQSRHKRSVNFARTDKGTSTVVMDTLDKIKEGNEQVTNENFYIPLSEPIVSSTTTKVKAVVNTLLKEKHVDAMTHKWLNLGQNPPRKPEFYTLTKIHKPVPVGRPIVSGSGGPTERISSLLTLFCNLLLRSKSRTSKTLRTLSTSLKTRKFQTKQFLLHLMSAHFTLISLKKKGLQLFANTMKSIISLNHPSPLQLLGNS